MKLLLGGGLCLLSSCVSAGASSQKRDTITDLSGGWCRSYKFGTNIAGDILRLVDLDGGLLPADGDGDNNYLIELPLTRTLDLDEGSTYRMRLVDPAVPKLKGQAFWSNSANDTLYTYGGQALSNLTSGDGAWIYNVNDGSWSQQASSIKPVRLEQGASVNAPEAQAGYWLGGFHSTGISTAAGQQTQEYASSMLVFNTTTQEASQVDTPFGPVQNGALIYLPYGDAGVLLFFGGERPTALTGSHLDESATPNDWDIVYIYDIAGDQWHRQPVTGTTQSDRTQFCAIASHDSTTETHQIWIMGGASYSSQRSLVDVSYLSIPSFQWHTANPLSQPRMTHSCEVRGRHMFAVGGRLAWADDENAGCYKMPAFVYDLVDQAQTSIFDPTAAPYRAPSEAASRTSPETWGDPALERIFAPQPSATSTPSDAGSANATKDTRTRPLGVFIGIAIGATVLLIGIAVAIFFFVRKRRRQAAAREREHVTPNASQRQEVGRKPVSMLHELEVPPTEMEASQPRFELMGDMTWSKKQLPELPGTRYSR